MRTPADLRSSAHQFSVALSGPANSLSPTSESLRPTTLKSVVPPVAIAAMGQLTQPPLFPSRSPPDPSTFKDRIESGSRIRSPSSHANRGCAAHDHGAGYAPTFRTRYPRSSRHPRPTSSTATVLSSSSGSEKHRP